VNKAFLSVVSGHHALLVFMISNVQSVFFTNQVHPEPKFPTALEIIAAWNFSKPPHVLFMASNTTHIGRLFSFAA